MQGCNPLPPGAFAGLALQCRVSSCFAILLVLLGIAEESTQNSSGIGVFSISVCFIHAGLACKASPVSDTVYLLMMAQH